MQQAFRPKKTVVFMYKKSSCCRAWCERISTPTGVQNAVTNCGDQTEERRSAPKKFNAACQRCYDLGFLIAKEDLRRSEGCAAPEVVRPLVVLDVLAVVVQPLGGQPQVHQEQPVGFGSTWRPQQEIFRLHISMHIPACTCLSGR